MFLCSHMFWNVVHSSIDQYTSLLQDIRLECRATESFRIIDRSTRLLRQYSLPYCPLTLGYLIRLFASQPSPSRCVYWAKCTFGSAKTYLQASFERPLQRPAHCSYFPPLPWQSQNLARFGWRLGSTASNSLPTGPTGGIMPPSWCSSRQLRLWHLLSLGDCESQFGHL